MPGGGASLAERSSRHRPVKSGTTTTCAAVPEPAGPPGVSAPAATAANITRNAIEPVRARMRDVMVMFSSDAA
jgi:hypothetical protein